MSYYFDYKFLKTDGILDMEKLREFLRSRPCQYLWHEKILRSQKTEIEILIEQIDCTISAMGKLPSEKEEEKLKVIMFKYEKLEAAMLDATPNEYTSKLPFSDNDFFITLKFYSYLNAKISKLRSNHIIVSKFVRKRHRVLSILSGHEWGMDIGVFNLLSKIIHEYPKQPNFFLIKKWIADDVPAWISNVSNDFDTDEITTEKCVAFRKIDDEALELASRSKLSTVADKRFDYLSDKKNIMDGEPKLMQAILHFTAKPRRLYTFENPHIESKYKSELFKATTHANLELLLELLIIREAINDELEKCIEKEKNKRCSQTVALKIERQLQIEEGQRMNSVPTNIIFDGNCGGISNRSQFWLLLLACQARGKSFNSIPCFIDWAFDNLETNGLNKEECQKSTSDKLKSTSYRAVKSQKDMIEFINTIAKQSAPRAQLQKIAEKVFVALKGII